MEINENSLSYIFEEDLFGGCDAMTRIEQTNRHFFNNKNIDKTIRQIFNELIDEEEKDNPEEKELFDGVRKKIQEIKG